MVHLETVKNSLVETVLDRLPIGVFLLQIEDKAQFEFRILYFNRTFSTIAGTNLKIFEGQTLRDSFPEVYNHGFPQKYLEALEKQKIVEIGEVEYGDEHISKRPFFLVATPLDQERVMVTSEDITKLKQANIKLKQNNQELEQMTYVTSHDLQEPLNTIASYIQLLNAEIAPKEESHSAKYMDFIVRSCKRMQSMVKDLMDHSRLGNKGTFAEVALGEVTNLVLEDLSNKIKQSKAIIEIDHLPTVQGASVELRLLLQNLISNALEYCEKDATPHIQIKSKRIRAEWQIAVQDNGIGIDPKHHSKIFKIFQRLHTRSQHSGTGIGLAHCVKVVNHHNGRMWVESTPGNGSTFYFTIPVVR